MRRVYLILMFSVVFWGSSFVATKIVLRTLTPAETIAARLAVGVPPMLAFALARWGRPKFARRDWMVAFIGALVLAAHFIIQTTGLKTTTATNTGWLIAFTPLSIALLARAVHGERLRRPQLVGIIFATVGVVTLVSHGRWEGLGRPSTAGDALAFVSTFTWAAYTVLTRDLARRHHPVVVSTFISSMAGGGLVMVVGARSPWDAYARLPLEGVVALLFLGWFCLGLAFAFWQSGVARLGAARAGVFLYLEPLATTLLAVIVLGETVGPATGVGALLILVGVYHGGRMRPSGARLSSPVDPLGESPRG
jgi:drug/metabolite transporter (DMT)-like permease